MAEKFGEHAGLNRGKERGLVVLWVSGAWVLPFLGIVIWFYPGYPFAACDTACSPPRADLCAQAAWSPVRPRGQCRGRSSATEVAVGDSTVPHVQIAGGVAGCRPAGQAVAPTCASRPVHGGLHARVQQPAGDCGRKAGSPAGRAEGRRRPVLRPAKADANLVTV